MDNGVPRTQREDKIVIHITDENDPPTDIRLDFNTIKENMDIGEMIGNKTLKMILIQIYHFSCVIFNFCYFCRFICFYKPLIIYLSYGYVDLYF